VATEGERKKAKPNGSLRSSRVGVVRDGNREEELRIRSVSRENKVPGPLSGLALEIVRVGFDAWGSLPRNNENLVKGGLECVTNWMPLSYFVPCPALKHNVVRLLMGGSIGRGKLEGSV